AFNDVGGFDPALGLIYFDDPDLSLSLWKIGQRTVYEPTSTVKHVGAGGTTPSPEVLLLAQRNRSIFERRWRTLLARYPLAPLASPRRLLAARDARSSDRMLVLNDAACADALALTLPAARVTLVAAAHEPGAYGVVERVNDAQTVLRERRFHYDGIVGHAS